MIVLKRLVMDWRLMTKKMKYVVPNLNAKTPVWKLFGFPGNGQGVPKTKGKVVCRRCRKEMPYKNNTTNLYTHLERHYKEEYVKLRPSISSPINKTYYDNGPKPLMKQSTMTERLCKIQQQQSGINN